jgi:glycosyltransferase involved in cell wall biosynthesis
MSNDEHAGLNESNPPLVSVVMPVRNEAASIGESIRSVLSQDYPHNRIEIIVADGMSTDSTREIIEDLHVEYDNIHLINNPKQIMPTGANLAIRRSKGDFILLLGGHSCIPSNYIRRCVEPLLTLDADCFGGALDTIGEGYVAQAIALSMSSPFGVGTASFRTASNGGKPREVDTVAYGVYRREVFDRLGGFDEDLVRNQDDEFNYRLLQAGGRIWLDPSLRIEYHSRANLWSLWRQYYQYGFFKVPVIQRRGSVPSWRHLVPGAFVLTLLCSFLLALVLRQPFLALVVLGPYALANLGASLWAARRVWKYLPFLPLAFGTLHLAYGTGFLWGLWRWRKGFLKADD